MNSRKNTPPQSSYRIISAGLEYSLFKSSSESCGLFVTMYRRALQTLFLSTLKRTSRINRATPCSCFHITHLRYADQPQWLPSPEPEIRKQFSELDSDTFGSLSEPSIHERVEEMPEEEGDCEEFDVVDDSGKRQRKQMFVYHKMIASLLEQKKVNIKYLLTAIDLIVFQCSYESVL